MVTFAEIARRVNLSKQRISQLAREDPDWPVPRDQWQKIGPYWQIPWPPVKAYFEARNAPVGLHRARRKPPPETTAE